MCRVFPISIGHKQYLANEDSPLYQIYSKLIILSSLLKKSIKLSLFFGSATIVCLVLLMPMPHMAFLFSSFWG